MAIAATGGTTPNLVSIKAPTDGAQGNAALFAQQQPANVSERTPAATKSGDSLWVIAAPADPTGSPTPAWNGGRSGPKRPPVAATAAAPVISSAKALEANAAQFTKMLDEPSGKYHNNVGYIAERLDAAAEADPEIKDAPWFKALTAKVEAANSRIEEASYEALLMTRMLANGEYDVSDRAGIHARVHARVKELMPFIRPEAIAPLVALLQKGGVVVDL